LTEKEEMKQIEVAINSVFGEKACYYDYSSYFPYSDFTVKIEEEIRFNQLLKVSKLGWDLDYVLISIKHDFRDEYTFRFTSKACHTVSNLMSELMNKMEEK